jgi:hypothetical protein
MYRDISRWLGERIRTSDRLSQRYLFYAAFATCGARELIGID